MFLFRTLVMMKSLVFLSVCTLYLAVMTAARDQDESNCHAFCAFGLKVPGCFCSKVASGNKCYTIHQGGNI